MRKLFISLLLLVLVLPATASVGWPAPRSGVYRIQGDVDLGGAVVTMEPNSVLDLTRGTLRNGTIVGNASSLSVMGESEVLEGIVFKGSWCGKVEDRWFRLEGNSSYWIVSNVLKFNEVFFFRHEYWLETWYPVTLNRDWMDVHGNGVVLYLPSDKGEAEKGTWGYKYKRECLFSNPVREGPGDSFYFEGIHIEDNAAAIGRSGWGEDLEDFRIYYYFEVVAKDLVFKDVSSDGAGILVKVYNLWQHIDRLEMDGCDVKAGQFAVEVGNLTRKGFPGGSCNGIVIRNCRFYQYSCQPYVGLLSVVGDVLTDQMLVEDCVFDATEKDGNLELSSVRHVVLKNNLMINQFVNSYPLPKIERYDVLGNEFRFRKHRTNDSFKFGGEQVVFKNNRLVYEDEDVGFITLTPLVRSIELDKNVFDFSLIGEMTESRTALALSSLPGVKVRMYRNEVIPRSGKGIHRFIFRLPSRMESFVGNRLQGVDVR